MRINLIIENVPLVRQATVEQHNTIYRSHIMLYIKLNRLKKTKQTTETVIDEHISAKYK